MNADPVANLDRSTLRERCLGALRTAITSGRYRPGEHLGEVDLASGFGVSRGTVREALRHLQQEGLVVGGSRGMLRVRSLGPREIAETYEVRAALEALAAETLAAAEDAADAVDALRAEAAGIDGSASRDEQVEADLAFHRRLCVLAGNAQLVASWSALAGAIRLAIMSAGPERALHNMASHRHLAIAEAIASGDPVEARRTVFEHMRQAASQVLAGLDEVAGG